MTTPASSGGGAGKVLLAVGAAVGGAALFMLSSDWLGLNPAGKRKDKKKKAGGGRRQRHHAYRPVHDVQRPTLSVSLEELRSGAFEEAVTYEKTGQRGSRAGVGGVVVRNGMLPWPGELLYDVLTYLPLHEAMNAACVSQEWKVVADELKLDHAYLRGCVRSGGGFLPEARGWCWKQVLRIPPLTERKRKMYWKMVAQVSDVHEVIERDGHRTLIHHHSFESPEEAAQVLNRVLKAYATHSGTDEYCQGLNFVAAFLLNHLPEEEAYWMLYGMMVSPHLHLRKIYADELAELVRSQYQFEVILEWYLPELAESFREKGVTPALYSTEWFMTLFTYRAVPAATSERIWDEFLIDGWKVIHRIGLAVLCISQEQLMEMDFEEVVRYLKVFPDQGIFDPDILLPQARLFKVTNRMLYRLAQHFDEDYITLI